MARICATLSLDNKGVNVEWAGVMSPLENMRILGVEWHESVLF